MKIAAALSCFPSNGWVIDRQLAWRERMLNVTTGHCLQDNRPSSSSSSFPAHVICLYVIIQTVRCPANDSNCDPVSTLSRSTDVMNVPTHSTQLIIIIVVVLFWRRYFVLLVKVNCYRTFCLKLLFFFFYKFMEICKWIKIFPYLFSEWWRTLLSLFENWCHRLIELTFFFYKNKLRDNISSQKWI